MGSGAYYGLPLAWLTAELEKWKTAHSALAGGQSYEIAGRSLTRVDLPFVQSVLRDIQAEITRQADTSKPQRVSYADFPNLGQQ